MLALPECKNVFVCGPVSSGKTHLIKQWFAENNRHVIFDGTGEFIDDKREQIWANPQALWNRLNAKPNYYRVVYQPGRNRVEDFGHVLNCLWWAKGISRTLVCDEFHEICPLHTTNEDVEMLLRFARHARIGFVGASQRIADVHKLFTSGCRMVVLFWTQEARDLEAIEDRWRCSYLVENLRPLIHDDSTGITKQIPQCVVCIKGQKPFIFDFATDSVLSQSDSEQRQQQREQDDAQCQTSIEPAPAQDSEVTSDGDNLRGTETDTSRM